MGKLRARRREESQKKSAALKKELENSPLEIKKFRYALEKLFGQFRDINQSIKKLYIDANNERDATAKETKKKLISSRLSQIEKISESLSKQSDSVKKSQEEFICHVKDTLILEGKLKAEENRKKFRESYPEIQKKKLPRRSVIRVIFGHAINPDKNEQNTFVARREKIEQEIRETLEHPIGLDQRIYVYGQENYDIICSYKQVDKRDVVLMDKSPFKWQLNEVMGHKIEVFRYAMEEDKFDEILFMDWDCVPQKRITSDIWTIMGKKESFQANLHQYGRCRCSWRKNIKGDILHGNMMGLVPNGGFVYIRNRNMCPKIEELWKKRITWSVEPPLSEMLDEALGEQFTIPTYWWLFEPEVCNLNRKSPFSPALRQSKNCFFIHYAGSAVRSKWKDL